MTFFVAVLFLNCIALGAISGPWGKMTDPMLYCVSLGVAAGILVTSTGAPA